MARLIQIAHLVVKLKDESQGSKGQRLRTMALEATTMYSWMQITPTLASNMTPNQFSNCYRKRGSWFGTTTLIGENSAERMVFRNICTSWGGAFPLLGLHEAR